ncbi:hypothetical protein [Chryseobacterium sp. M5A1_1a]
MKKIFYFIALLLSFSIILNCSSERDESTTTQGPGNIVKMPEELVGSWKIKHYTYLNDPNFGHDETAGYYINIQSDNKVKYKDPNGERSGTAFVLDNGDFYLIDQYIDFRVSDSKKYPGQKEFIVKYNNEKIYYSGIMTGEKN